MVNHLCSHLRGLYQISKVTGLVQKIVLFLSVMIKKNFNLQKFDLVLHLGYVTDGPQKTVLDTADASIADIDAQLNSNTITVTFAGFAVS